MQIYKILKWVGSEDWTVLVVESVAGCNMFPSASHFTANPIPELWDFVKILRLTKTVQSSEPTHF